MSGLLALLDDVAAIAKVAAASVDDVIGQAAKAGAKSAGAIIDDAAVTPKYVQGFAANRELPIIWRITKGSFKNKLLYLLPVGLVLANFAPWAIPPLLMLGGAYLCFEGAEKVAHVLGWGHGHSDHAGKDAQGHTTPGPADRQTAEMKRQREALLEEKKAAGAIKTDFILSAEIMTISLAAIPPSNFWMEAATLAAVAIMITVVVYGSVALIVKADDLGLAMAARGRMGLTRALGQGIVRIMPGFLKALTIVGTAAMLWVGGSIIVHGLAELGWHAPEEFIYGIAMAASGGSGAIEWMVTAAIDGILGLAVGFLLIPIGEKVITPVWRAVMPKAV